MLDYAGNYQRLGGVAMLESYVREFRGEVEEIVSAEEIRKPQVKKERKVFPGVRTLVPINPMTGEAAKPGDTLTLEVHDVSCFALNIKGRAKKSVMVQYVTTTPENARIDCSLFLNTEDGNFDKEKLFFHNRRMAVKLPVLADVAAWQIRAAKLPKQVKATKKGKYWNVVEELF